MNRGRLARDSAPPPRQVARTATAIRSPSRSRAAPRTTARNRTWNRRRARSPSCRGPCSPRPRDSRGQGTRAACARTGLFWRFPPRRTCPPTRACRARAAKQHRPRECQTRVLRANPGPNRGTEHPSPEDGRLQSLLQLICNCIWSTWFPKADSETGGFGGPRRRDWGQITPLGKFGLSASEATRLPATFNRLPWANPAPQSAEQIALAASPIVAVLLLGVGEGETGLLQTALTLPFVLFAIPAGLLADRISRRRLMAGAEALRAVALFTILALIGLHQLTMPLLALTGFVAVCGTVAYSVAAPALVPSLVSADLLPAANARIELARTIAFASGPALGGVLVGWVGAAPAFEFAAALSVLAVVLLSGIYEPTRAPAPRRHPLQEIKEGAVFVFQHSLLRPVFVTQFIFNIGSFLVLAIFVPYAVHHLALSATGVGTTLAMYGVGMVVGPLLATRVMRRIPFGAVIGLGPVTGFVAAGVMALTTIIPSPLLAGLSFFLLGVGPILWVIST